MKQITDKLIAVLVPYDSFSFDIDKAKYTSLYDDTKREGLDVLSHKEEDFNIIGTITQSGQFDFDFNSTIMDVWEYGLESKKTFLSLLNSKGIFLDQLQNQKILILEKA